MIFISYANEDHRYACKLYLSLRMAGLDPWMDKPPEPYGAEGLRVGQRWRTVLDAKLREADNIVLVLSPTSVKKKGFVNVEFRTALSLMNELPDDRVFVLPILTQQCDVPSMRVGEINLLDLHWEIVKDDRLDELAARLRSGTGTA